MCAICMTARSDRSVSVAFGKGTLDSVNYASPWSPPAEVLDNISCYMKNANRVLKDDGVFLYMKFGQSCFIKPFYTPTDSLWDMELQNLGHKGSLPYRDQRKESIKSQLQN